MKATQGLHNLGQSIWLDNITRDLLDSSTLKRYIDELSVTGLTSNPGAGRSYSGRCPVSTGS
jgi:transaldolase